jgi:hypothetical protein
MSAMCLAFNAVEPTFSVNVARDHRTRLDRHVVYGARDCPRTDTTSILERKTHQLKTAQKICRETHARNIRHQQRMRIGICQKQRKKDPLDPFSSRVRDCGDNEQEDQLPPGAEGSRQEAFLELFACEDEGEVVLEEQLPVSLFSSRLKSTSLRS